MSNYITFNVVSTGDLVDGFDAVAVRSTLEGALRMPSANAEVFFDKRRVLKKGLMKAEAEKVSSQLAKLGIVTEVEKVEPRLNKPAIGLELEPVEDARDDVDPMPTPGRGPTTSAGALMTCPKCSHEQPHAEQCEKCQVWFHKLEQAADTPAGGDLSQAVVASMAAGPAPENGDVDVDGDEDPPVENTNIKAMAGAAAAALIGALVWKFVAVAFGIELALVAWGIGGAVGFAAASLGSQGLKAGIVCGVLAFGAIGLGKYWATQAVIGQIQEVMVEAFGDDAEISDWYAEFVTDAEIFDAGSGSDEFVRQFMVDRNYSEATRPADVTNEELTDFREYTEPDLRDYAQNETDIDGWKAGALNDFGEVSTSEVMLENLGVLDLLFLFLGVWTAFKLGARMD